MNKIYIDTGDNQRIVVRLQTDKREYTQEAKAHKQKAQMALPLMEKLLKQAGIEASEIDEINVLRGPGSFTGLRVGISVANALSLSNLVGINGKKLGDIETAIY